MSFPKHGSGQSSNIINNSFCIKPGFEQAGGEHSAVAVLIIIL